MKLGSKCVRMLSVVAFLLLPASAGAQSTGGAAAFEEPRIEQIRCVASASVSCPDPGIAASGAQVQVRGSELSRVRAVTFRGGAGRADDITVRPAHVRPSHVEAVIPARARTGRVELRSRGGGSAVSRRAMRIVHAAPAAPAASPSEHAFPIAGGHDLGQSSTNNFGGARNHKGQDMFAKCGTPLVAAQGGTVRFAATQARAGNYLVVTGAQTGWDYVYMHMRAPATVKKGDTVQTGQPIGEVGDTGNASGCHLHFELWSAPGWYEGGSPFDPLPQLQAWRKSS